MMRKTAIVIRGPMGVGKSTVADELCKLLATGPKIVLDEFFHVRGHQRSAIFAGRRDNVLVFELGCGEPLDLSFDGFTRGAEVWHDALQQDGRGVHFFKLWAEWDTVQQNMARSRAGELLWASLWHRAYSTQLNVVALPPTLAKLEVEVDVTGKKPAEVARQIIAAVERLQGGRR